jgi:hypothetical protein
LYLLPLNLLDYYGTWGVLQAKGRTTAHPKNGLPKANHLVASGSQSAVKLPHAQAMLRECCHHWQCLLQLFLNLLSLPIIKNHFLGFEL